MLASIKYLDDLIGKGKRVFISQPMKGKDEETIRKERKNIVECIEKNGGEVIDTIVKDHDKKTPLECLSESIKFLSEADIALFMPGYENARGCMIELECCKKYNIDYILANDKVKIDS